MLDRLSTPAKVKKSEFEQFLPELQTHLRAMGQATRDAGIPVVILMEGWRASWVNETSCFLAETLTPIARLHVIASASDEERQYPWLWRFWKKLPANSEWAIFNRSWYWRVLSERMDESLPEKVWRRNYRDILEFEQALTDDGLLLIKIFFHHSKQELRRRLEKLYKKPSKKKNLAAKDWEQHYRYRKWLSAYEEMFERTDTQWAPWIQMRATKRRATILQATRSLLDTFDHHELTRKAIKEPGKKV